MILRAISHLILITSLIISPAVKAGDTIPDKTKEVKNYSPATVRMPGKEFIDSYVNDKDYFYGGEYKPPEESRLLNRLWRWIESLWKIGLKALRSLPVILRVGFYVLCLVLLVIIITKSRLYRIFYDNRQIVPPDYYVEDPLDEHFDFAEAIRNQIMLHNFRNAIRLLHLKLLSDMDSKGIVKISREKTNRDYTREITNGTLRSSFAGLATIYNRVWFGNYNISEDEFDIMAKGFYTLSEEINDKEE